MIYQSGVNKGRFARKKLPHIARIYPGRGGTKKHMVGYSFDAPVNIGESSRVLLRRWSAGARSESEDNRIDTPDGNRDGRGYHHTVGWQCRRARRDRTPHGRPRPDITALRGLWGRS